MSTYLVTGGCGFIGSHIAEELARQGRNVRVLDNFYSGYFRNISSFFDNIECIYGDIRNFDLLVNSMQNVDYVFHQAALTSVPLSIEQVELNNSINVLGTFNVLLAAQKANVKRVVLASSASVYGNSISLPKTEESMPYPESPYALSKLFLEKYAQLFNNIYGLETVVLRYFNVYGIRQNNDSPYSGVITSFIRKLKQHQSPIIYGNGQQTRDFVFVKDVVQANLLAMFSPKIKKCEIFNIATGRKTSLLQLLEKIQNITGYRVCPIFKPNRCGDILDSYADISRAQNILQYEPTYSLDRGLTEMLI
jgi:UDP-glucose 4-epimerase